MHNDSIQKKTWFKNPIVWMIIFFPSLAIVAGFITLFIAIDTDDGLVHGDYYKQGLGINKTITKDNNAINLNITGLISINGNTGSIQAKFSDKITAQFAQPLVFKLSHRTIAGFDQMVQLKQIEDTLLFTGKIQPLPIQGGLWRWDISNKDWRIGERFVSKNQEVIVQSFPSKI